MLANCGDDLCQQGHGFALEENQVSKRDSLNSENTSHPKGACQEGVSLVETGPLVDGKLSDNG